MTSRTAPSSLRLPPGPSTRGGPRFSSRTLQVIEMIKAGVPRGKIARDLSMPRSSVRIARLRAERWGALPPTDAGTATGAKAAADIAAATGRARMALASDPGATNRDLAARANVSVNTIHKQRKKLGIPSHPRGRRPGSERLHRDRDAAIVKAIQAGLSYAEIMTTYGINSRQNVDRIRKAAGLPTRRSSP